MLTYQPSVQAFYLLGWLPPLLKPLWTGARLHVCAALPVKGAWSWCGLKDSYLPCAGFTGSFKTSSDMKIVGCFMIV